MRRGGVRGGGWGCWCGTQMTSSLCATREQAEKARELVAAVLETLGLRLAPEKTRIVRLAGGAEGFDFLGFHHRMGKSRRTGRWIC